MAARRAPLLRAGILWGLLLSPALAARRAASGKSEHPLADGPPLEDGDGHTGRKPADIYEGGAWHLSEAGRQLLARRPRPPRWSLLQDAAGGAANASAERGDNQIVVYYTHGFFGAMPGRTLTAEQCELPCTLASYPGSAGVRDRADLLVSFPIEPEPPNNARGAPALAFTMEAAGRYGSENFPRYDGTANTSLLSTVPQPYFGLPNWREIQRRSRGPRAVQDFPSFRERLPAAAFIARNCGGDERNLLLRELVQRGVPVHSISDCAPAGTGRSWPEDVLRSDKVGALRRYRVYLALENLIQPTYVSEKAIDGFAAGAVPVYMGAPDVGKYVPRGGFISATEAVQAFGLDDRSRRLDALANNIMAAIENEATWTSYLAWRAEPLERVNGGDLARRWAWSDRVPDLCRYCRFAYARLTPGARWDQERQQAVGGAPPPPRGDPAAWAAWRRGARRGSQ